MPDKVTLKIILFFSLLIVQFNLKGQALSGEASSGGKEEGSPHGAWYFPYESLEKAIAADPSASERSVSLEGPWKFSAGESPLYKNFYTPGFDDSSWETIAIPNTAAGYYDNEPRADNGSRAMLFRKKIRLDEGWTERQLFISPGLHTAATIWVNGHEVGQTKPGSGKREFNISSFVQPGENLLALKLDVGSPREPAPGSEVGSGAETATVKPDLSAEAGIPREILSAVGKLLLYARPQLHFNGIDVKGSLDKDMRKGVLKLDLQVANRMDSVRERFWGVLREPIYSDLNLTAQLVDDKGNSVIDFKKESNRRIQGGKRLAFHFEGTVDNVKSWSHERPYCYRLNITLLDGAGQVLEAVSQQVGFRTVEMVEGMLQVNGTPVPLRVFQPEPGRPLPANREELMQDIRQIKQDNFNAVYASSYFAYPSWYRLSNRHGVYILDKYVRGNRNHPSVIPIQKEERIPASVRPVVDLELADFLKGTVRLRNHFAFRDLSTYYLEWEILRNGEKAEDGAERDLMVKPGEEKVISLDYKMRFYEGNDYFLNLRLKTKMADSLVPAGVVAASRQFRLGPYQYEEGYQVDKGLIDVTDGPGSIALNGYDFRIVFDKRTGQISRYSFKGRELLNDGPELNFRKLLDPQDSLKEAHSLWNRAAEKGNLVDYRITEDVNGNYYLSFTKVLLGGDARLFQKFRVDGRGAILVENVFVRMQGDYPLMPGFGTSFRLPADYRRMEWYGREPGSRNEVGIYAGSVDAYAGNDKRDVRWVRLTREDGYGLLIRKEKAMLNLTAVREGPEDSPLLLSVDLSQEPLPFKSINFTYRIIPYVSSANVQ